MDSNFTPSRVTQPLSVGACATLACNLEVTAPKPGNVHRGADFPDLHLADFLASAAAIGPALDKARDAGVGEMVYAMIQATRQVCSTNTNLGIALLFAPLAVAGPKTNLAEETAKVLHTLKPYDSQAVYAAINLAQPGGMGEVNEHDLKQPPPDDLLVAMRSAEQRDRIAWNYVNDFADIWWAKDQLLMPALQIGSGLLDAIIWTHVALMASREDSLISRKRGDHEAATAAVHAQHACAMGPRALASRLEELPQPNELAARAFQQAKQDDDEETIWGKDYRALVSDLDFWLRSQQGRNPGTTADLVTATLFAALLSGDLELPTKW